MSNPYQAPSASVSTRQRGDDSLDDVVSGQKHIIYAILLYFLTAALQVMVGPVAALLALVCLGLSFVGLYKLSRGLGDAQWLRIVLMVLMLLPLIGLLVLVVMSSRGTSRLRKAGYSVGLMGARNY